MSEAAAATPAPEPPTLEEITAAHAAAVARAADEMARLRRSLAASRGSPGDVAVTLAMARLADFEQVMLAGEELLRQAATVRTIQQALQARQQPPAPAPEARRHRHRAPRPPGPGKLRGLPVLAPAGLAAALRHSWAAHPVITAATGTAAVALATAAAAGPGVLAPAPAGGHAGVPAPAASAWSAAPVPAPSSSLIAVTRPKANAASSRPLAAAGPSPAASAPPAGDPSPQDSPDPQAPAAGTLTVSTTGLDLGIAYLGTITVTAAGGPVSWGAVKGSGDITLDVARGALQAGESAVISVGITAAAQVAGGSASVRVWGGSGPATVVTVSWDALPVLPADLPSAVPSLPVP